MTTSRSVDFLIAGGGIMGVAMARQLRKVFPQHKILILEKEPRVAEHASGRNSGVLHAGFYYTADSLKAKFTRTGQRMLREFIQQEGLRLNPCGKLVVAQSEEDLKGLQLLYDRGQRNQVQLEWVDEIQMRAIEPRALSYGGRALFSPTTASADPTEVLQRLQKKCEQERIDFLFEANYSQYLGNDLHRTNLGDIAAGYFINTAGLYADVIARQFGLGEQYRIVPYKGVYLYADKNAESLRTHIYPVPNLKNPFLGVHFTVTVDGRVKIGPTAIPALWREQYEGVDRFKLNEFSDVLWRNLGLMISGKNSFASLAFHEIQNLSKWRLANRARPMLKDFDPGLYRTWGRSGIRAQLVDLRSRALVTDFVFESTKNSLHLLNTVSPGWTSSFAFAEYLVEGLQKTQPSISPSEP